MKNSLKWYVITQWKNGDTSKEYFVTRDSARIYNRVVKNGGHTEKSTVYKTGEKENENG